LIEKKRMRLHDGTELSAEQIEELNAHGPYSMAVWESGDVKVGNEEGLKGRSAYFTELIRKAILENFSLDELKSFSILDVGCNDGWVLHQLSDLPFSKMVGIEPREKNIAKGRHVREILKLNNRAEYRIGDIESLGQEAFDIVICAGVLYHVESIPIALRNIRDVCKRMVFIESRCVSSKYITRELMDEIEMRDLVYQFRQEQCGITAQKFESGYHDGSAKSATIVNVPSAESLIMNLDILGFEKIDVVADLETYRASVWQDKRPLSGVCITATLGQESQPLSNEETHWIDEYEKGLESEVLPRDYLEPIYRVFCLHEPSSILKGVSHDTEIYLTSADPKQESIDELLPSSSRTKYAREIVQNWRYSPSDKVALEYGKLLKSEGRTREALEVLKNISCKLNADWRSVYRSFHLIATIYKDMNSPEEALRYQELCLRCNAKYPV